LLEYCLEKFSHVSSLEVEQKKVVHLPQSKDIITILLTGSEKSLIYQLYATAKEMQMVRMLLFSLFRHSKVSFKMK